MELSCEDGRGVLAPSIERDGGKLLRRLWRPATCAPVPGLPAAGACLCHRCCAPAHSDHCRPLTPSPCPAPAPVTRWADIAELDDVAASRPVVRRDPPPRPAVTRVVAALPLQLGGAAAPSRSRRLVVVAPPSPPRKAPSLGHRTARRRRASAWVVTGRSDQGRACVSWRSAAAAPPASSSGVPPRRSPAPPSGALPLRRTSPFRPFIAAFGTSSLCLSPCRAPRRSWPVHLLAPAPAAAGMASRVTLAPIPLPCRLGRENLGRTRTGLPTPLPAGAPSIMGLPQVTASRSALSGRPAIWLPAGLPRPQSSSSLPRPPQEP
nr:mucin-1-like [Aegilops tauschii subsp. strangulata]